MYKSNCGRKPKQVELSKGHFTENDLDRRERILNARAERDAVKQQEQKEMNAWLRWVNQDGQVAAI